jgi:hypothetical protein
MSEQAPEVSPEISRFDAENATALTADFLKRLGYKGVWLPMKVSLEDELYVVEMMNQQKKTAKVQINSETKEIREYEFAEEEKESCGGISKGKLIFLMAAIGVSIALVKLLGVF